MIYYPVFLDLRGKPVLVVGAGKVALRKTRGLLEAGARVTVVSPRWEPAFDEMPVMLLRRAFEPGDIEGASLVFTATDIREVNRSVALLAKARAIPVNVADAPPECDFLVPARVRRGSLQVAISTGGQDPRRAVAIRRRIEDVLEGE
ncbi:MAG TPA: bifunctional precorrin-2 dehydrogenase/sirohydrochlorin ferrochelatase [Bryobacteraceae bacterium]|nr:bifunctional precorrin-2 dehydrogenase/sirohydrochlorin ferrochelatase [Bryobacteraceae bacterium]